MICGVFQLLASARMGQVDNWDNEQSEMNRQKQKAGADVNVSVT